MELTHTLLLHVNLKNGPGIVEIYSYFPYDNNSCGRDFVQKNIALVGVFDLDKIEVPGLSSLYTYKLDWRHEKKVW